MDKSSHRWGPWDQHLFDSWGTHEWHFYRQCLDCETKDVAPSRSVCDIRDAARQAAMVKSVRLAGWRG